MISENQEQLIEAVLHFLKQHGGKMGEGGLYNAIQAKFKDEREVLGMKEIMKEYQDTLDFLLKEKVLDRNKENGVNYILTDNFRWLVAYTDLIDKIADLKHEKLLKTTLLEVNIDNANKDGSFKKFTLLISILALLFSIVATSVNYYQNSVRESSITEEIGVINNRLKTIEDSLKSNNPTSAPIVQEIDSIPNPDER